MKIYTKVAVVILVIAVVAVVGYFGYNYFMNNGGNGNGNGEWPHTGDINGDGNVNSGDARYIAMYLTGDPLYQDPQDDMDTDCDGDVDDDDSAYLQSHLAGIPGYETLYPC